MGTGIIRWRPGRRLVHVVVLGLVFTLAFMSGANAALYLKFDGIEGESPYVGHEKWIVLDSVQWGVSVPKSGSGGGGGSTSKPIFQDLSWKQVIDASVIGLFDAITKGKIIKDAFVDFTTDGDKPFTYFQMEFRDVTLTSLSIGGTADGKAHLDGAFGYDYLKFTYTLLDTTGKPISTSAEYDLKTMTGSLGMLAYLYGQGTAGPPDIPATPIPSSGLLLGSGLLGLIGLRRKLTR